MIIASNWHPQKRLNYLSATVIQRAEFFLPLKNWFSFNIIILIYADQSLEPAEEKISHMKRCLQSIF